MSLNDYEPNARLSQDSSINHHPVKQEPKIDRVARFLEIAAYMLRAYREFQERKR